MIIEIKGVEFENKGAELMLVGILQRIQQYWPSAQIALSPSTKSPFLARARLGAWQKLSLRKSRIDLNYLAPYVPASLSRKLRNWGIVLESDIDVIIDASGFSYSDQWGSDLRIRHAVAEARRLKARGGKYIFMPQAMGPFHRQSTRMLLARGFPEASLVCARDEDTLAHIEKACGRFDSLRKYKDFTNVVSGTPPAHFKNGDTRFCIIPNRNMVNPRNKNRAWIGTYIDTLATAARIASSRGLEPILLNHEGEEDGDVIREVIIRYGRPIEVFQERDPAAVKGIIQSCRASLSSRYHGCVSALSSGKPSVGTSWSHKYERLYEDYGAEDLLITPGMSEGDLRRVIDLALDDSCEVAERIKTRAVQFKSETESLWREVKCIIDSVEKR